jgi:two-component system cell cycle response regulator DivK
MAGESILIVDDTAMNLKLTRVLLSGDGYTVHTACDAEHALEVLDKLRPNLILMDVQMPGMDGLELTRLLKRNPDTKDIPVVALTAYAMSGDEERTRAAGCDGYIPKPINTRTFGTSVAGYLARTFVDSQVFVPNSR